MNKSKNTQLELNLCLEDENSGHENKILARDFPPEWQLIPLKNAVTYIDYGYSHSIPKIPPENGIKIVSTADISKTGELLYSQIRKVEAPLKTIQRLTLHDGDVLFNWRNSSYLIGKTTIFEEQSEPHIFASFVLRLKCDEIKSHNYFFKYLLNYYRYSGIFESLARRAVNQANFNKNEVSDLIIPLPPIEEQRKIASVLTLIQEAIQEQENAIALTTELKKALMQKLFTEGINNEPQKMTEIGLIPESWEVVNLGNLAKLKSGGTPSRKKIEYWENGSIPWVKTTEINYDLITTTEEYITKEGLVNSSAKMFSKGTLLMAMYGQGVTRGRVGILDIDATTNQACVAIMPNSEDKLSTKFLYHYFSYHYEKLRNQGHGANQSNLSSTILKMFPITFPKIQEQLIIINHFDTLNLKLEQSHKRITILQDLFSTLLHQLMTAQIRVDELELSVLEKQIKE
ncbi:restriction modification system DNA specificity domain protein [Rippkaea orientalis PCC 8801]|uniref:Restriction modification system DNA specificity domain protein n=1 Tax=Rippkaea orientalis (strain PCC 8801 / RF-1) TaxID=41431 RepID=B7K147_RIPO1|nr:restriction endonuclease subunit S [Rippkaea orientalis]ACK66242.1 restriction modification system DNA specificity domain protein [Rippkaea orientalis PCC 8801]